VEGANPMKRLHHHHVFSLYRSYELNLTFLQSGLSSIQLKYVSSELSLQDPNEGNGLLSALPDFLQSNIE
jgi:hypothetical protein